MPDTLVDALGGGPDSDQKLWVALSFAYMAVITAIAAIVSTDPARYRPLILVLVAGKLASSLPALALLRLPRRRASCICSRSWWTGRSSPCRLACWVLAGRVEAEGAGMSTAAVTPVDELDPPDLPYDDPTLRGPRFHEVLADLREQGWLAKVPLGYAVLDRESCAFFLRTRSATFPGLKIAEIFQIDEGPLAEEIRRNILHLNGQDHSRLRNLVNPSFTPRAANRWRPAMREILEGLWAELDGASSCEFVDTFAKAYPSMVIATVMGAPLEDAPRLHHWSDWIQRQFDATALMEQRPQIEEAVQEFYDWAAELLERRRDDPREDLISTLLTARHEGDRLDDDELINLVLNVLVGGVDTTQSQLAQAHAPVRRAPRAVGGAAGRPRAGARGGVGVAAGGADHPFHRPHRARGHRVPRRAVPRGDGGDGRGRVGQPRRRRTPRFDITAKRDLGKPLTFGAGPHYCLGANLAQAEMQEGLRFYAERMPGLALDGEPEFGSVQGVYGLDRLPLRWEA